MFIPKTKEEYLWLVTIVLNVGVMLWVLKIVALDKLWGGVGEYIVHAFLALIASFNISSAYRMALPESAKVNRMPHILRCSLFWLHVMFNVSISLFMLFQVAIESLDSDTLIELLIGSAFLLWTFMSIRKYRYARNAYYVLLVVIMLFALSVPVYKTYFISCSYTRGDVVLCDTKSFSEVYWEFWSRYAN